MVGGALAFCFHEHRHANEVIAIPFCEWFEQLQAIAQRINDDFNV